MARRCAAEFVGTFILVVVGPGAAMVSASTHAFGATGVALAFGLVVTLVVSAIGHVSGAHINPAVTIGFWSVRRFAGRDVLPYVVAQCAGAVVASAALVWIVGPVGNFGATVPAISIGRAFAVEAGYTAILGLVIMGVATDARTPPGVAPFAIGATIFGGALVTGPLTGGSFNPARSFGPAVVGDVWTSHWLYWVAPIVGAIVGMHTYDLLRSARVPATSASFGAEGPIAENQPRGGRPPTKDFLTAVAPPLAVSVCVSPIGLCPFTNGYGRASESELDRRYVPIPPLLRQIELKRHLYKLFHRTPADERGVEAEVRERQADRGRELFVRRARDLER
jgi:MIP family channel proteins